MIQGLFTTTKKFNQFKIMSLNRNFQLSTWSILSKNFSLSIFYFLCYSRLWLRLISSFIRCNNNYSSLDNLEMKFCFKGPGHWNRNLVHVNCFTWIFFMIQNLLLRNLKTSLDERSEWPLVLEKLLNYSYEASSILWHKRENKNLVPCTDYHFSK